MAIVYKTIGGNVYAYKQTSKRVNGKVVTTSVYLYPVTPRRVKKGNMGFLAFGLVGLGISALKGDLKPYKERPARFPAHPRSAAVLREQWEANRATSVEAIQAQARAGASKPAPIDETQLAEMKEFSDRLAAGQVDAGPVSAPDTTDQASEQEG